MDRGPMLAATLPMPRLPLPPRPDHFSLRLDPTGARINLVCWCGAHAEIDTYDAWAGRCIERFCHDHADCQLNNTRAN